MYGYLCSNLKRAINEMKMDVGGDRCVDRPLAMGGTPCCILIELATGVSTLMSAPMRDIASAEAAQ